MGLSHEGSATIDWETLAENLALFEDQNNVRIEVSLMRWTSTGGPDISLSAKCWEKNADRRVAKPLAFTNVRCRAERYKSVASAIFYLLYQLDFALGESEWQKTGISQSETPAQNEKTDV